jgi:uncharacterized membrane protein
MKRADKKKTRILDKYSSDENFFHKLFKISIGVKGINSLIEIFAGIFLFFAKPEFFSKIIQFAFHYELIETPKDMIVGSLIAFFSNLSVGVELFAAIYLFIHGFIKLGLVIGLWKGKLWTYILAEIVFGIFVMYQVYRFFFTYESYLIFLTLFDLIVMLLTWIEYRQIKKRKK